MARFLIQNCGVPTAHSCPDCTGPERNGLSDGILTWSPTASTVEAGDSSLPGFTIHHRFWTQPVRIFYVLWGFPCNGCHIFRESDWSVFN